MMNFNGNNRLKNLPWVTVYNPPTQGFTLANKYNIQGLPTTYIFANGELADRITDLSSLDNQVAKRL